MYGIIKYSGISTYISGLICKPEVNPDGILYMVSLFGTGTAIEAIASAILSSHRVFATWEENGKARNFWLHRAGHTMTSEFRKYHGDGVATKILYSPPIFGERLASVNPPGFAIVTGPDMPTVKKRAFLRLDQETTVPLKEQWANHLWDEILQPEKLISWGCKELNEAWMISIPSDGELQEFVLEGIRNEYLT